MVPQSGRAMVNVRWKQLGQCLVLFIFDAGGAG